MGKATLPPAGAGVVLIQLHSLKRAFTYEEIQDFLGVDQNGVLKAVLDDLVKRGNLKLTTTGRYKVFIPPRNSIKRLWQPQ
jgi:predicted transcriptional regulator of viral defense system